MLLLRALDLPWTYVASAIVAGRFLPLDAPELNCAAPFDAGCPAGAAWVSEPKP